jgi:methylmalonyl-CoA mutase cobalamin-binding domain/chain
MVGIFIEGVPMSRLITHRRFLDALNERVLIFDGAMGTSLQKQNLTAAHFGGEQYNGCNDYLVISYPAAVEKVHRSFLEVGVDVLETNSFRSNRITLGEYGLADRVLEINAAAARLARRLADEYAAQTGQPRFVAGSIGPSGKLPSADDPELSNITYDELADVFREQAAGLLQGQIDLIVIETSQDILELRAALAGVQQAFTEAGISLPVQAQVTLDTTGRMLLGTDISAALAILEGLPIDVIGLNCSTGPEHMREPIRYLGENAVLPVSCIPNAGLPLNVDGEAVYPLEAEPFAQALTEFVEKHHISVVGGCCGTTPAHMQALVKALGGHPRPPRPASSAPRLASSMRAVPMQQNPPPMLLGERCNAQGSRKFKRILLAEDYDTILELAREQVEGGAHALDISVAVTERADEAELMRRVVKKLAAGVDVPLVIDTTEPEVMEVALKTAPGRCLLNSTHLEGGRAKADRIFALAKAHNAAVLVLTIDESGMAKTVQRKVEVAKRIYDIAVNEHGLKPEALVFDTLTFTLATGDPEFANAAVETLEGIRQVKAALPGVLTSLGVSNASFGLNAQARPVLNSVLLYHAVQAGLDMAIVNPASITPYAEIPSEERDLSEDLIFNRRPDALQRFIAYFEQHAAVDEDASKKADPTEGMTPEQRLHWRILHRHKEGVEADIDEIIARDTSPSPAGRKQGEGVEDSLTPAPSPEGGGEQESPSPDRRKQGEGVQESPSPTGRGDRGEGNTHQPHHIPMPARILALARTLRTTTTNAEQLLWQLLRNRALNGVKFRRQHPIAGYVLDFYCHEAKLAIELDGSQHLERKADYDEKRTQALREEGIRVLRFWNNDVLNQTEVVLDEIWRALEDSLTPGPSPEGGGVQESRPSLGGGVQEAPSPAGRKQGEGVQESPSPTGRGDRGEGESPSEVAVKILNTTLLPAMKEVGDRFGSGELILPFVLQSAEVMKKAVAHIEQYLERKEGTSKGTVVLATVYGDVHDIGKNLVKTILANNGYTVHDLGKQTPAETIITKAVEIQADAIGLSALLVSTSKQMPLIVNELSRRGLEIPVLVGGAAINRRFGWRINLTEQGSAYAPGVFYCKDAFEGLAVMDALTNPQERPALLNKLQQEIDHELGRGAPAAAEQRAMVKSSVPPAGFIPRPAAWGTRHVEAMPLELVFQHLSKNELFRLSWGAKNAHGAEWLKLQADFEARLERMCRQALREGWFSPQAVYGYWPAQSEGNDLVLYDPASLQAGSPVELARFSFPRQPSGEALCLADYFAPAEAGRMDVAALQVVTVGQAATERFDHMQEAGDYAEAYYFHGLAVQTAEATAEYLHRHIRRELGLAEGQGKRYSWGYPAIPDLEDHRKVFDLLPAETELGMSLSPAYQLIPEQSTAAIIVHHPEARYFGMGESRLDQLTR